MSTVSTLSSTRHLIPEDPSQNMWTPSIFNITSIISKLKEVFAQLQEANSVKDEEGKRNAYIRFLEHPFLVGHSLITVANLGTGLAIYFNSNYSYLSGLQRILGVAAPVLGLPLATMELVLTICNIRRDYSFERPLTSSYIPLFDGKKPENWIEAVSKQQNTLKNLLPPSMQKKFEALLAQKNAEALSSLFLESDLLHLQEKYLQSRGQQEVLARRVQPWLEEEIQRDVDPLLKKLRSEDLSVRTEGKKEAAELLHNVQIQIIKKKVGHFLALVAMTLTIAGLILSLVPACPYLIPTGIIVGATLLVLTHCFYTAGYWNTKGWVFSWSNCVPNLIKTLWEKIHPLKKEKKTIAHTVHFTLQDPYTSLRVRTKGTYRPYAIAPGFPKGTGNAFLQEQGRRRRGEVPLYQRRA